MFISTKLFIAAVSRSTLSLFEAFYKRFDNDGNIEQILTSSK